MKTKKYLHNNSNTIFSVDIDSQFLNLLILEKEWCLKNDLTPIYDDIELYNISGKTHTLILENSFFVPEFISTISNTILKNHKKSIEYVFTNIKPTHIKDIEKTIIDNKIKNICLDSLFQNIEQFRFLINNIFIFLHDINFFIKSPSLLNILQDEYENHKDKYNHPNRNISYLANENKIYLLEEIDSNKCFIKKVILNCYGNFVEGDNQIFILNDNYFSKDNDTYFKTTSDNEWK